MKLFKAIGKNEFFLVLICFISIVSMSFSHGIPFMPIIIYIYILLNLKQQKMSFKISTPFLIFYLSVFCYLWGVSLNQGVIYQTNKEDIANMVYYFLIILIGSTMTLGDFELFKQRLFKMLSYVFPFIALLSIYKFYLLTKGAELSFISQGRDGYPSGSSLIKDYNMYSLGMSVGFVALIYYYNKTNSLVIKVLSLISVFLIGASIYLSGSRRGIIILLFLIIYFFFYTVLKKDRVRNVKKRGKKIRGIILFFVFFTVLIGTLLNNDYKIFSSNEFERIEMRSSTILNFEESFSGRTNRWEYGLELVKEFNFSQFLVGQGFIYLDKFQERFNTLNEDYPHNFLISSLLYSGLIGMFILLILLVFPLIKLLRNLKEVGSEILCIYILTLVYLLNSGNSLFSIRILPIFIIIIALINTNKSINEKKYKMLTSIEKQTKLKEASDEKSVNHNLQFSSIK